MPDTPVPPGGLTSEGLDRLRDSARLECDRSQRYDYPRTTTCTGTGYVMVDAFVLSDILSTLATLPGNPELRRSSGASPNIEHELMACEHALAEALGEIDVLRAALPGDKELRGALRECARLLRHTTDTVEEALDACDEYDDAHPDEWVGCSEHPEGGCGQRDLPEYFTRLLMGSADINYARKAIKRADAALGSALRDETEK